MRIITNLAAVVLLLVAKDALILGVYGIFQAVSARPSIATADLAAAIAWLFAAAILGVIAYLMIRSANRAALLARKVRVLELRSAHATQS